MDHAHLAVRLADVVREHGSRPATRIRNGSDWQTRTYAQFGASVGTLSRHLIDLGIKPGESTEFDITFPEDYPEESLAGQTAHFSVDLKELREKVLPEADDDRPEG